MENMDNFDRISDLPELQAVQTSVLSKIWQQAPVLHFDHSVFNDDLRYHSYRGDDPDKKKKLLKLFNSVEEALRNRHKQMISITKFTLELFLIIPLVQEFEPFIDQCIFYAIETHVKELRLKVSDVTDPKHWQYKLSQVVLCSKSINVLVLDGCKLESPTSVRLSSLRELHLSSVNVADQVIEDLVTGCPLIEVLRVHQCRGFKILELLGHSKLSDVTISSNQDLDRLVIEGLSVHSIEILGPLPIPGEVNVASCKNLKSLHFSMVSITDEWLSNQISYFPLLECLDISMCQILTCVKISSLHMKKLRVSDCKMLSEVKIETPNLRIFKYEGDIISFTLDGLALSKTELLFHSENIDTQWFDKYIKLLSRFYSFSKVLTLRSSNGENLIIPEEVRQIQHSPLCNVEDLNMVVPMDDITVAVKDVVDGLLWILPHAKTISLEPYYPLYDNYFFKFQFSYKRPPVYEGGIAQCCKSCPISCWQECIDEVEIEYCTGKLSEDGKDVKRYNFKGEDIWVKIDSLEDLNTADVLPD